MTKQRDAVESTTRDKASAEACMLRMLSMWLPNVTKAAWITCPRSSRQPISAMLYNCSIPEMENQETIVQVDQLQHTLEPRFGAFLCNPLEDDTPLQWLMSRSDMEATPSGALKMSKISQGMLAHMDDSSEWHPLLADIRLEDLRGGDTRWAYSLCGRFNGNTYGGEIKLDALWDSRLYLSLLSFPFVFLIFGDLSDNRSFNCGILAYPNGDRSKTGDLYAYLLEYIRHTIGEPSLDHTDPELDEKGRKRVLNYLSPVEIQELCANHTDVGASLVTGRGRGRAHLVSLSGELLEALRQYDNKEDADKQQERQDIMEHIGESITKVPMFAESWR